MHKSTHEEHLSQALQTNDKQFKIAVNFLTGYNGIFNVKNSNIKFYFKKTITNEEVFFSNYYTSRCLRNRKPEFRN